MLSYNIIRSILLEVIDGGSITLIQILMSFFFTEVEKKSNSHHKEPQIVKLMHRAEGITPPISKPISKQL